MLVSCWTHFRRFVFTNRFRERLSREFWILALPLLPLNDCTPPYFFHWVIALCTVLSPMAIIYNTSLADFTARCKPITCLLSKTEVRFAGFFSAWLFMLVVVENSCSTDYNAAVRLNATIVTIFHFFKFCYEETCKKLFTLYLHFTRVRQTFWPGSVYSLALMPSYTRCSPQIL